MLEKNLFSLQKNNTIRNVKYKNKFKKKMKFRLGDK